MKKGSEINMKQTITIKVKLLKHNIPEFNQLTNVFTETCNCISKWIFNNGFELNQAVLNKELYYYLRNTFQIKAQLTQSAIRCVVAKYKTVKTQLSKKPFKYYDKTTDKTYYVKRDLTWLQKPILFKQPQADLQRNRDWSFVKNQLSINTLDKRIKTDYVCKGFEKYKNWKLGLGKLIKINNIWYFYVSATKEIPDYQVSNTRHVVGIDRGLRFLATCYDEKGKTTFVSGNKIIQKRRHYKKLRSELQSKNTKSAKRRLKKIGHRENRWMTDVNHCITKTLVNQFGKNTLFVLEDLTGVTFDTTKNRKKENRYEHNSWAFYQFEQDLTYKANLNSSQVIEVPAYYTSQRCIKCGRINKENRNHDLHLYICDKCGYKSNDDRIAAMNIQLLGTEYVSGNKNPKFIVD